MEVILLQDIKALGLANSLVEVKPGYAQNYLIPQGFAIAATERNRNMLMQKMRQQEERAAQFLEEAKELAVRLASTPIRIAAKAGTSGKIFGSVNSAQISQAIKELYDLDIERKSIRFVEEVKTLGSYPVEIVLHKDVKATLNIEVFDEK